MIQVTPPIRFAAAQLATGVRLSYAEQGDPGGEVLVFVHGIVDSWYSFSRLLPLLPSTYHAFALDQRGHGNSERPVGGYTIDDFAADAAAFLDAVGATHVILVGHSMGSLVARRVAKMYPERVTRLVLINSVVIPPNAVTLELEPIVRELTDPVPPEFVREFQASTAYVPLPEAFFERVVAESLKLPARIWQSVLDGLMAFDDAADLGWIATPTLLLWGERDAIFPRAGQERLAARIPGARLMVYPETGHAVHWERPEQFVQDLEAFIKETSPVQ